MDLSGRPYLEMVDGVEFGALLAEAADDTVDKDAEHLQMRLTHPGARAVRAVAQVLAIV